MPTLPLCGGIMPQVGGVGKRILAGRRGGRVLPSLLTPAEHPCSVRQYKLPRSATMPMGRDPLTSRATANPSLPLVTAKRSFLRGAGSGILPALIRNLAFLPIQNGRPYVSYRRLFVLVLLLFVGAAVRRTQPVSAGDEWQPISQEELKMTSVPEAPGALAVYLYRQVDRDDSNRTPHEYNYARIKILTEEGRKYADVEIPFFKDEGNIHGVKARTIRPDGSIVNFEGKAFDKTIVKAKGVKYLAKTFTLPDVQVGCIIEYHYMYDLSEDKLYNSHWILSEELFTKRGKFSLKPDANYALRWSWPAGLPTGTAPPKDEGGFVRLESQNIPAFQIEDYMPPQNELKYRVDFVYSEGVPEKEPDKFWKKEGKKLNDRVESFTGKRKAMEQAVAEIVAPNDTPEVKLEKIYAKVQKFRNTSWETEKTQQEQKREKQKDINNVEDLWKRGYGDGRQINWLFLALARAAGFEAYSVYISSRSEYFFKPQIMNAFQLNGDVVLVKLNGKEVYCDPATAFAPFGLLSWPETGVQGLRLDKEGGGWVTTTLPPSSDSRIERKADLKLTETGSLEGKLTVTFSGLEALWRRIEERNEDATNRKKFLEDQVKEYIPAGIDVDLTKFQAGSRGPGGEPLCRWGSLAPLKSTRSNMPTVFTQSIFIIRHQRSMT